MHHRGLPRILTFIMSICISLCSILPCLAATKKEEYDDESYYFSVWNEKEGKYVARSVIGHYDEDYAETMYELLNEYRIKNGKEPLSYSSSLQHCADKRAVEISYCFSHTRPNGKEWYTVVDSGYSGENIGSALPSPKNAMSAFEASASHNENLLSDDFKSVAISAFARRVKLENGNVSYIYYVVQSFSKNEENNVIVGSNNTENEHTLYYDAAVEWAKEKGLIDGSFDPNAICTRETFVSWLYNLAGSPTSSLQKVFCDVNETEAYFGAIQWAYEQGITTGRRGGETFDPNGTCTRREIVTFLWRYVGKPEPSSLKSKFKDVTNQNEYYYKAVLWAIEENITTGKASTNYTTFDPLGKCTNGMAITFTYRCLR